MTLPQETLLALYQNMLTIRLCEERLVKLYASGKIYGGVHTYIGEEAVATGVCAHLNVADVIFSTHRSHGHALSKGVTPRELIAELLGRSTGCSGGRGGSMHLFKPETGMLGSSGIVGPSILLASGAAYTFQLLNQPRVSVAFFGDGAANNGAFHEGLNLAAAWNLPVIFVCENNLYATEIPLASVTRNPEIATRAQAYGLPGLAVDGNDVIAVYQAAGEAIERARTGRGPTLLECKTYRTRPHAEGMREGGYRLPGEVAEWKGRDPIKLFENRLVTGDPTCCQTPVPPEELDQIKTLVSDSVEQAVAFALASPLPDPATVTQYVYSTSHANRQVGAESGGRHA